MASRRAQIQLQFNWIFVLIAGAVILLFFFGLIYKQRAVAEERLQIDVARIIGEIFVGAGVSEKTKNLIDIPSQYQFYFTCDDQEDIHEFGVVGSEARQELPVEALFAPHLIQAPRLVTWSLPIQLPYKVMDVLIVTVPTIKYVIIGSELNDFRRELEKDLSAEENQEAPRRLQREGLNVIFSENDDADIDIGANSHVRFVYIDNQPGAVPASFQEVDDERVSAVWVQPGVTAYYQKSGNRFTFTGDVQTYPLSGAKESLRIASIFAADAESYRCNVMKVFHRMKFVNKLYQQKMSDLIGYYSEGGNEVCQVHSENVQTILSRFVNSVRSCAGTGGQAGCRDIAQQATELQQANSELARFCPISLY
jgi:hypothetical protein